MNSAPGVGGVSEEAPRPVPALVHSEQSRAGLAVQLGSRERRHDCGAPVSSGRGPHGADVRPASHDAAGLRSRPRQVGLFSRAEVQVLSTDLLGLRSHIGFGNVA